jgi:hypothetical protein
MSGDAAAEALGMVAAVRDDPARRLELASRFYDDRPGRASIRSYRRAEMAFMRWQVQRGLLAAPDSARPGSAWWRSVNEGLLCDAWEADRLLAGSGFRPGPASRPSVSRWSYFLRRPGAVTWYRAHNASIVAGYLEHQELCAAELPLERFFMNVALARVLYAHALVARPKLALGRMRGISRVLGDPRWRGADLFLSLHNILPIRYPLDGITIGEILALENYTGRLIDYGVILPRIQALYAFAAADLEEPRLLNLIRDGLPAYAWTNDENHPWTTTRSPRLRSVLGWVTS